MLEIATYLAQELQRTVSQDVFYSSIPPETEAPIEIVCVLPATGLAPDPDLPFGFPAFDLLIRAETYDRAEAVAQQAAGVFLQKANFVIGTTHVFYAKLMQEPITAFAGYDSLDRALFRFQVFLCIRRD